MLQILVHLYAGKDGIDGLQAYESAVMPILREHGGKLCTAFRPKPIPSEIVPDEIHLVQFPSDAQFQAYRTDPRLAELSELRSAGIARAELFFSESILSYE